jgi:hypothetical protein
MQKDCQRIVISTACIPFSYINILLYSCNILMAAANVLNNPTKQKLPVFFILPANSSIEKAVFAGSSFFNCELLV